MLIGAGVASGAAGATEPEPSRPPGSAPAAEGKQAQPGAKAKSQPAGSQVDPQAVKALRAMGRELRELKDFQVTATTSTDFVLESGQVDTRSGTMNLVVRKPNRLFGEVRQDGLLRNYFFDGKTFTLFAPEEGNYASREAPQTIRELMNAMEQDHGLELPLADLFRWGAKDDPAGALESAVSLGPTEVGGVSCEHFAFQQEGLDWQVWIQSGEFPLPRKLILTTLSDPARPQYEVEMNWNLAPAFNEAAFQFQPPEGAQKVALARPTPSELGFGGSGNAEDGAAQPDQSQNESKGSDAGNGQNQEEPR